jgi:hypothetical protein
MARNALIRVGFRSKIAASIVAFSLFSIGDFVACSGQTIQLPTLSFFNVRTVVSVPDGGTMGLGGVSRHGEGFTSRSAPGLGNIPFAGRLFRNQGIGFNSSASNASVNVQIISLSEYEQALLSQHAADLEDGGFKSRTLGGPAVDPNGSHEIQRKAKFISDNIGRKR